MGFLLGLGGLPLAGACTDPQRPPGESVGVTVRDSAGIELVENHLPAWSEGEGWSVDPTPLFTIGDEAGDGEQLGRITAAALLSDGGLAVADGFTEVIHIYSPAGALEARAGGQGDGPGEFSEIGALYRYRGDSIAVGERSRPKTAILTREGTFVRQLEVREEPGARDRRPFPTSEGDWITWLGASQRPPPDAGPAVWDSAYVVRLGPAGETRDTLGHLPIEEFLPSEEDPVGFSELSGKGFGLAAGASVVWGISDQNEFRYYSSAGRLARVVRVPFERRAVTSELRSRLTLLTAARFARGSPFTVEEYAENFLPPMFARGDTVPAFPTLLPEPRGDDLGNLWIPRYPTEAGPEEWDVVDPDGRWLGLVTMPPGAEMWGAMGDRLLAVWFDEFDVQHLRVYRVVKQR